MMKKRMKILAAVLLLPLALCLSAGAAETDAQRERDEAALRSAVTGEAQPYLAGTDGQDVAGSFARLLRNAVPDAKSAWAKAAGSLGAAAGIRCLCRKRGKPAHIVIDLKNNMAGSLIAELRQNEDYEDVFISGQDALVEADPRSLLIVVDTNRPDQVESKELLESIRATMLLKEKLVRPFIHVCNGAFGRHQRTIAPMLGEMLLFGMEPTRHTGDVVAHLPVSILRDIETAVYEHIDPEL